MDNGASSYRRFLEGDKDAFDGIMEEYHQSLIFFIDRYVQDTAAAEDIAIDVFAELIVHPRRYNFKVSLKTYLFMMGRSRALNYIKRRNRIQTVPLEDVEGQLADRMELSERLLADGRQRAVNDALCKLPEDMRTAVHLVYFEELSYEEAAKVMGKTRKQVDNLLYRAKGMLRTILGKVGEQLL